MQWETVEQKAEYQGSMLQALILTQLELDHFGGPRCIRLTRRREGTSVIMNELELHTACPIWNVLSVKQFSTDWYGVYQSFCHRRECAGIITVSIDYLWEILPCTLQFLVILHSMTLELSRGWIMHRCYSFLLLTFYLLILPSVGLARASFIDWRACWRTPLWVKELF